MSSQLLPKLASAEVSIMQVIWDRGPISVRDVVSAVNETRRLPVGRNTILKQMQRLEEKGWLRRDSSDRPATYVATVERVVAERTLAESLRDTVFGGSSLALVRSLIGEGPLTQEEVDDLRNLINEAEQATSEKGA